MAIINRISRLFTADMHAVLDRIEEPAVLLRQCVRDMEEQLADAELRVEALACECEQIESRKRQIAASLTEIESQLDVCFEAEKTDLARNLIRRRLENQRFASLLDKRLETTEKNLATERAGLDDNRARLESMRQKADLFGSDEASRGRSEIEDTACGLADCRVGDDEVEVAFLAEQQRRMTS